MVAGSLDAPFTEGIHITMFGNRETEGIILGTFNDVSNKVVAVTGNLWMYGNVPEITTTRLLAPAYPNDNTITITGGQLSGWNIGDEIVIGPSERNASHSEVFTIQDWSDDGNGNAQIVLDGSIEFYHYGGDQVFETEIGELDMRAEIGHLTRNIIFEGTDEDGWGGRIYTTVIPTIYEDEDGNPIIDRGQTILYGVGLTYMGQANTSQAGLAFELLKYVNPAVGNRESLVQKTVVRDSEGMNTIIHETKYVAFLDNIFFGSKKVTVQVDGDNEEFIFRNNLVFGAQDRNLDDSGNSIPDTTSGLFATGTFSGQTDISNNTFTGCVICLIAPAGECDLYPGKNRWAVNDNVVHSGFAGVVEYIPESSAAKCAGISFIKGYNLEIGVNHNFPATEIRANNILLTEVDDGIVFLTGKYDNELHQVFVANSFFAGHLRDESVYDPAYANCSDMHAIMVSAHTVKPEKVPPKGASLKIKKDALWEGRMDISGSYFENFYDNFDSRCQGNVIFTSNKNAKDNSGGVTFHNNQATNVGRENVYYFKNPDPEWIGLITGDCGGYYCTGITNIIVKDLDGSLTDDSQVNGQGTPKTYIPNNKRIVNDDCNLYLGMNGYSCNSIHWGLLSFESLDWDRKTRIVAPVNVTTDADDFRNDLNSYADHAKNGFYTGLEKLQRFHSLVQTNRDDYQIHYTGTVPDKMRFQLHHSLDEDSVVVYQKYTTPQTVKVTLADGTYIRPKLSVNGGVITDEDECGANVYQGVEHIAQFKLTGADDCELIIELTNSVKGAVRYEIDIFEFFDQDGPTEFIDRVALVLGIDPTRVRVSQVTRGSSIVAFDVDGEQQPEYAEGEEKEAIIDELEEIRDRIEAAIQSGDLDILGSKVLDYELSVSMKNSYYHDDEELNQEKDYTLIIVGIVVAALALAAGIFVTYKKKMAQKKKAKVASHGIVVPKQVVASSVSDLQGYDQVNKSSAVSPSVQHLKDDDRKRSGSNDDEEEKEEQHSPALPSIDFSSRPFAKNDGNAADNHSDDQKHHHHTEGSESSGNNDKDFAFSRKELYLGSKILLSADIPGLNFKQMAF